MLALPLNVGVAAAPVSYTAPIGLTPHEGVATTADPIRQRVVLTGGLAADAAASRDSTWEWDGLYWSQLPIASPPTAPGGGSRSTLFGHRSSCLGIWEGGRDAQ